MSSMFPDIPRNSYVITLKRHPWLWLKFYWYKWILRKDIIGFFAGIPIIRSKYLEPDPEKDYIIGVDPNA